MDFILVLRFVFQKNEVEFNEAVGHSVTITSSYFVQVDKDGRFGIKNPKVHPTRIANLLNGKQYISHQTVCLNDGIDDIDLVGGLPFDHKGP